MKKINKCVHISYKMFAPEVKLTTAMKRDSCLCKLGYAFCEKVDKFEFFIYIYSVLTVI